VRYEIQSDDLLGIVGHDVTLPHAMCSGKKISARRMRRREFTAGRGSAAAWSLTARA
jgi:hypothetical protein